MNSLFTRGYHNIITLEFVYNAVCCYAVFRCSAAAQYISVRHADGCEAVGRLLPLVLYQGTTTHSQDRLAIYQCVNPCSVVLDPTAIC